MKPYTYESDMAIAKTVVVAVGEIASIPPYYKLNFPCSLAELYDQLGYWRYKSLFVDGFLDYSLGAYSSKLAIKLFNDLTGSEICAAGSLRCLWRLERGYPYQTTQSRIRVYRRRNGRKRAVPHTLSMLRAHAANDDDFEEGILVPTVRKKHFLKLHALWEMHYYGRPRHTLQKSWKQFRKTRWKNTSAG